MSNLHPIFETIVNTMKIPSCGECKMPFTVEEVAQRNKDGLNVFDKDTLCDMCWAIEYAKDQNRKFEESRHPDDNNLTQNG